MSDLDRLWFAQFGTSWEVALRVVSVIAAALGLWFYDGALTGPIWAVIYLGGLAMSYYTMQPSDQHHPLAWSIGIGSHVFIALGFAWLPLYLISTDDMVLNFCGFFGMVGLGAFTLFREEPPDIVQPLDIVIAWAAIAIIAYRFLPEAPSLAAQAVMGFLCLITGGYYSVALWTTRSIRRDVRKAAERTQEEREMEAIGRLTGGIAHDFNNILTALHGSLELYAVVPEGPEQDALVDEARAASVRATALVSQLLAYARRAPLEARIHDANAVIDELCTLAQRLLPAGVQLDCRRTDAASYVLADAKGLNSALLNLLLNANDALEGHGSIVLAVDVMHGPAPEAGSKCAVSHDNAHLCFSVADDGPGMAPDVQQRAMEPFFTTKPIGKGSGLGLSMALGFAEQSGGALRIKTGQNGTTVALHLPMSDGPDTDGHGI
ncbi:hypothetical protein A8B78_06955 [Jannaschia sp. EhC01]|nr:hypothetical protein A8B78_06955 [Jannaschia sp. EhC01]